MQRQLKDWNRTDEPVIHAVAFCPVSEIDSSSFILGKQGCIPMSPYILFPAAGLFKVRRSGGGRPADLDVRLIEDLRHNIGPP